MCGEKPEQMEGALSMRLEPVIEWGRRGIKEEGNLEGVDMYLPLGYTLYRARKNPKDVQCTLCTYKYLGEVKVFLENVWLEGEH